MFCPQCGQERVSTATNYCSRCGFLLTAVGDLLQTGGQNPLAVAHTGAQTQSPRKRGLKQGVFLLLLTFLLGPLMGMISMQLRMPPFLVGIAVVVCFMGGLLRMVYALMFESVDPGGAMLEEKVLAGAAAFKAPQSPQQALPAQPASAYAHPTEGRWRDTKDLEPSVTESTTQLLEPDEGHYSSTSRRCKACNTTYTDPSLRYCLVDGAPLIEPASDQETLIRSTNDL